MHVAWELARGCSPMNNLQGLELFVCEKGISVKLFINK